MKKKVICLQNQCNVKKIVNYKKYMYGEIMTIYLTKLLICLSSDVKSYLGSHTYNTQIAGPYIFVLPKCYACSELL